MIPQRFATEYPERCLQLLERVDLDRIRDSQGFLSVIPCF